ncbi:MAG: amidohydrolase family protein [Bryobacter sp.]|nr:amidohydrolase family protein [Bryobacter sp.]
MRWVCFLLLSVLAWGQDLHGKRPERFVIRNVMVVDGSGAPAAGPRDVTVESGVIAEVGFHNPRVPPAAGVPVIDGKGRYLLPGLINIHAHIHEERAGRPMPLAYSMKLWLACGITTIRDVASDYAKTSVYRAQSAKNEMVAPRIFVYPVFNQRPTPKTPDEARARVRDLKAKGADGVKFFETPRDIMAALLDEAHRQGMRTAHHAGVAESNAWDDIKGGTTTIEHWYGIPDAAVDGVQNFPATYNYANEVDRFRYAGRLWREAKPERLAQVLDGMVKANVGWVPTLNIYEASRDLMRYQNQPWFQEFLHPGLAEYFKPNPANHGSYFLGWTSTDEAYWKENYRLWMAAVREFGRKGGVIGIGEDAGYIYNIYGFGMLRSLELHQEAGFHPLEVIRQATANNAALLGQETKLGRVRAGFAADLILVNGNPLEDFKLLYPGGSERIVEGKTVRTGGIEWTINDGVCYHAPTLAKELKALVAAAQ